MPSQSFADFVTDWERLLLAVSANGTDLPDLGSPVTGLQGIVAELRTLSARQDANRAAGRADTRRIQELLTAGRDAALQIRSRVRAQYGPRNEKLAEFRVRVLGRRRNSPIVVPSTPPPPQPE